MVSGYLQRTEAQTLIPSAFPCRDRWGSCLDCTCEIKRIWSQAVKTQSKDWLQKAGMEMCKSFSLPVVLTEQVWSEVALT